MLSRVKYSRRHRCRLNLFFFFFNDAAPTEISSFPLHDALPISENARVRHAIARFRVRHAAADGRDYAGGLLSQGERRRHRVPAGPLVHVDVVHAGGPAGTRSEEHTSELQSQSKLVCRLLPEIKK